MIRALLIALALMLGAMLPVAETTAAQTGETSGGLTAGMEPRKVMVMLDLAPDHLRAGSSYGGDYGDAMGERQRQKLARKIAREHHLTVLESWPMLLIGVDCVVMQVDDDRSVEAVVAELGNEPGVAWSQPLNQFELQAAQPRAAHQLPRGVAYNDRLLAAQPVVSRWHLTKLHGLSTGRGVTIAIIDSKVDAAHPDLAGQIAALQDFIPGRPQAERHGTGIAGIIAARPNNALGIAGIAPDARILALRACWERSASSTVCDSLSLAKALSYAIERNTDVINLSLSGPRDRLVATLVQKALARGASVVAAIDQANPSASFPALLAGVIAVGDERLSGRAATAYIAPGLDVPTTMPEGKWNIVSGSSYAAAHVSGLVALLRQLSGKRGSPEVLLGPRGAIDACLAVARVSRKGRVAC